MSRCPTYLLAAGFCAMALALPLAQAQGAGSVVPAFTLTVSAVVAEVYPGEVAVFNATVANPAILAREASMMGLLPAGWTNDFSVDPVSLPRESSNSTTWRIFVPASATPGTYSVTVEAKDNWSFTRANASILVKEPPVGPGPTPPSPPDITLAASVGDSAQSGQTARGTLTITSRDPRTLSLVISIASSGGWSASVPAVDQNRQLFPGDTVTAALHALVPELSEDATREFTVSVRASTSDATKTFSTGWTVLGKAAEPSVFDPTQPTQAPTDGGSSSSGSADPGRPATSGPNLDVFVDPLEVQVPSGGQASAIVHLVNTGGVPLTVTLEDDPPLTWRPFAFESSGPIQIPVGGRADVPFTITAPDNLIPGGSTTAKVYAIDGTLVRSSLFHLSILAGAPVDQSETATVETPAAPEGGVPTASVNILVVAGLAAVGSAAIVVASRPLREKLVWVGVGLYTRLARPDVLGHEDREKLYRLVETQPGIHFHALQRDLGWNTGTLTYHLRVLERHGFVVSRRDGLYRRFYLSGAAPRKEVFENQGPTGLRADVIEAIKNTPGISQTDLALGLGANKQTVNYHVKALERSGTIRLERRGRDTFLFPGGGAPAPAAASSSPTAASALAQGHDEADDGPVRL